MDSMKCNIIEVEEAKEAIDSPKCPQLSDTIDCIKEIEISMASKQNTTPLQMFYKNQCIFLTEGTGFLGKILIERLFSICPDISRIYILMRPQNKNLEEMKEEFLNDPVFKKIKCDEYIDISEKIVGVFGDCTQENLGLSDEARKILINEVTTVFHLAGTVRPSEKLIKALQINCQSTIETVNLCKNMKNLKSFMYVSSAHSHCNLPVIDEKFYGHTLDHGKLVDFLESMHVYVRNIISRSLINPWPDTHTFSKAMAEDLIKQRCKTLPTGVFRPGMLSASLENPAPGWCDNREGVVGLVAEAAMGCLRVMRGDAKKIANLVPVDMAAMALIACAHDTALHFDPKKESNIVVYNYVSTEDAPITWGQFRRYVEFYANQYPFFAAMWYCSLKIIKYKFIYVVYCFLYHRLPALFMNCFLFINYEIPTMDEKVRYVEKLTEGLAFFALNERRYKNNNVKRVWDTFTAEEKEICKFDMRNFDWQTYLADFVKGVRVHLLKDPLTTLADSRRKQTTFKNISKIIQTVLLIIASLLIYGIFF